MNFSLTQQDKTGKNRTTPEKQKARKHLVLQAFNFFSIDFRGERGT
jgi:hypothetical protein